MDHSDSCLINCLMRQGLLCSGPTPRKSRRSGRGGLNCQDCELLGMERRLCLRPEMKVARACPWSFSSIKCVVCKSNCV